MKAGSSAFRAASLAAALSAVTAGSAPAQMFVATGRDALRGLPGVEVQVEAIQPEIARRGLSGSAIGSAVIRRLRDRRIPVYGSQRENPSPAKAYLYVHVNALELPGETAYAVALQLQVRQTVRSEASESHIVDAVTWDAHDLFRVPAERVESLQLEIQRFVDRFIDDWTAVH